MDQGGGDPPALVQITSFGLHEIANFFRHLATGIDSYAATGQLPPSLFTAQPVPRPAPPRATSQPSTRQPASAAQPAAGANVQGPPDPGALLSSGRGSGGLGTLGPLPISAARPRKKRKQPGDERRRRPPTGYNLFVRAKLESLRREGRLAQFQDSKAAFKAAVEDWRQLPDELKRQYTQQAGELASAAQAQTQSGEVRESVEPASSGESPTRSVDQGPEATGLPGLAGSQPRGSALPVPFPGLPPLQLHQAGLGMQLGPVPSLQHLTGHTAPGPPPGPPSSPP